jgi:methyl-accepting chemotaxis protein
VEACLESEIIMTHANPDTLIDEIEGPIHTSLPSQREHHLLLNLPIAKRLMLGFLSAALIAVIGVSVVSVQHTTSLSRQANFYQSLVRTNATLTNGANLLQLMTSKTNEALAEATSPTPSQEDLATTLDAVHRLIDRYDTAITAYTTDDILSKHPEQMELFSAAQVNQQRTLATSTARMWDIYHHIQEQVLQYIVSGNVQAAQYTQRFQAEPANGDALNAVNTLTQFNEHLAATVEEVENVEAQQTLMITIVSAILAFLIITLIGIFVSRPLIVRLNQLLQVILAVDHGDVSARVAVVGRDEIGRLSTSMNSILETIMGLQEETRQQHNALVNAAERLLADIKVVSVDDLRVGTTIHEDPIRMLASALNFTIRRLQRFAQHTQAVTAQMEAISHRELEHAKSLTQVIAEQKQDNEAKKFHVGLAVSAPQPSSFTSKEAQDQIINMQHMSTQFAQEIIYLANQLASLAEDLKQSSAVLQTDDMEIRDRGESPPSAFADPFGKPSRDADSLAFPPIPDFVQEIPDVRKE